MKKVKNYVSADLAKKKIARYKYWSIKDEMGITITSSNDEQEGRSFTEILDKIISDNVDAEIQVKFGTNEQSSRQNNPIFIRVNETIEWVEPEDEETVKVNGVPHRVDKNGNVNINFQPPETPIIETPNDIIRQEMELQLEGLRKESELKEQRYQSDLHNKLAEQTLQFKEMMLKERENRIAEREQVIAQQEAILEEKEAEISNTLKGYAKHIPSVLGSVFSDWIKGNTSVTKKALGETQRPKRERKPVSFEIEQSPEVQETPDVDIDLSEFPSEEGQNEINEIESVEPQILENDENLQD